MSPIRRPRRSARLLALQRLRELDAEQDAILRANPHLRWESDARAARAESARDARALRSARPAQTLPGINVH